MPGTLNQGLDTRFRYKVSIRSYFSKEKTRSERLTANPVDVEMWYDSTIISPSDKVITTSNTFCPASAATIVLQDQ